MAVAVAVVLAQLACASRYGYNVDELYFRLLAERGPAWGYVDQPPLVPLLVHTCVTVLGDTVEAIRWPAALCAGSVVVLGARSAAELGGTCRAQVLTAAGLGTSVLVLSVGHVMVTSTLDLLAWSAIALCALRALLREDGRWWWLAGAVVGVALYAKYVVALLPLGLVTALLLVGPRDVLRRKDLWIGAVIALVVGSPNLVYQFRHGLPQAQMAQALAATDGPLNRILFLPGQVLLLGPVLSVVWVTGLVGLLRRPQWRPVRGLGVAYVVAGALTVVGGGRPDYVGGFLVPLFAAGCVRTDDWLGGRRWRPALFGVVAVPSAALQVLVALPLLPAYALAAASVNDIARESLGWPQLTMQVAAAYDQLPDPERHKAVVLAHSMGSAAALDRYGGARGLPRVFSGQNELHRWGPPPESARTVVTVGFPSTRQLPGFSRCELVGWVDNGLDVQNAEQGAAIQVCRGRTASWASLWPAYHYLSG